MNTDFDVAIIGGGPNGAVAAALLARHGGMAAARIALIAPELAPGAAFPAGRSTPADQPPRELPEPMRVAAISRASELVLHNAQAWSHLPQERICAYQSMRVWHESVPSDGPEALVFSAAEVAEPNLGYIVENRALSVAGLASFKGQGGQVLGVRVVGLQTDENAVRLQTDGQQISARLVIGADGAHSQVREFLKIAVRNTRLSSERGGGEHRHGASPPAHRVADGFWAPDRLPCCHCSMAPYPSSGPRTRHCRKS